MRSDHYHPRYHSPGLLGVVVTYGTLAVIIAVILGIATFLMR